jgi:hypothetical protein
VISRRAHAMARLAACRFSYLRDAYSEVSSLRTMCTTSMVVLWPDAVRGSMCSAFRTACDECGGLCRAWSTGDSRRVCQGPPPCATHAHGTSLQGFVCRQCRCSLTPHAMGEYNTALATALGLLTKREGRSARQLR